MKKALLFSLFFLAFCLCACSSGFPEEAGAEEQTDADSISMELASIVYLGERITAPGAYQDVPAEYVPVLDDLYLYGELLRRYEALNRDGKITQEMMRECEAIQKEIEQRGHISYPYGGIEGTSGYALVDLDGDDRPELLLLDNSSRDTYRKQVPAIHSIYSIRDRQLVCIESGSFAFENCTVLVSDGTFYQCVDYQATGYAELRAFHLEAGKTEFTILSDAYALLSFSEGDVPIPYWVTRENGHEVRITEEEFGVLLAQYKDPSEPMKLNFVPLHPGAVDPWSVPLPAEEPILSIPMECPQSYAAAPEEYKPILDDLYLFSERLRLEESFAYTWEQANSLGFAEPPAGALGYAVADLNGDGILELLLGTVEGLNGAALNSVFTLREGKPLHLKAFWSRSRGIVAADGTIYSVGSGGAAYTYLSSFRLDSTGTLTQCTDMRSDYSASEGKPYFVQVADGRNYYISMEEFAGLCEEYENPAKKMALTVIPIAG